MIAENNSNVCPLLKRCQEVELLGMFAGIGNRVMVAGPDCENCNMRTLDKEESSEA